jgi:hypothetical protein
MSSVFVSIVKCAPEIPMYDPDSDPARDDPNPPDNIFWDLDEEQLFVFRTGGTWADVFRAAFAASDALGS